MYNLKCFNVFVKSRKKYVYYFKIHINVLKSHASALHCIFLTYKFKYVFVKHIKKIGFP